MTLYRRIQQFMSNSSDLVQKVLETDVYWKVTLKAYVHHFLYYRLCTFYGFHSNMEVNTIQGRLKG